MSTSIIEPGTRLAGRYRLEERVSESPGSTMWKATDEILARAVSVRTFEPDFPRAAEVVTAARTASRLTDPRLTQVFDADDTGELAYVVSEWVSGDTLEDMILSDGPLEPGRAATFVSEAAEALTAAHSAGLAHLCLGARNLVWTTGGTVKLTGIAVDAVLCSVSSGDPARIDALGLGQMLYAALTGQWPGSAAESALPLAPEKDGDFTPVRELRPDVSAKLNDIVSRCMDIGSPESPLTTPAEVVAALVTVPRTPLPLFSGMQGPPPSVINRPPRDPDPQRTVPAPRPVEPAPRTQPQPQPQAQRVSSLPSVGTVAPGTPKPVNRPMVAVAGAIAAIIVGVAAWQLSGGGGGDKNNAATPPSAGSTSSAPAVSTKQLKIVDTKSDFGITPQGSPDNTLRKTADLINDNDPSTYWASDRYNGEFVALFGRLIEKPFISLDLGEGTSAQVTKLKLTVPAGSADAKFEIRSGSAGTPRDPKVGGGTTEAGAHEFTLTGTTGRFVVIVFTTSPPSGKLQIGEADVFGTSG
jgi:serine/threonine protein kinase